MPISPTKEINLFNNVPLNKINMKLEKSVFNPYSISASDYAFIEENEAKERDSKKRQKVEEFHNRTI